MATICGTGFLRESKKSACPMRCHVSAEFLRTILDYSPETGIFTWRYRNDRAKNWNTRYAGTRAGQYSSGYLTIQIDGKGAYTAGRLAWLYMTGKWPQYQVDHINRDRSDNRFCNLRAATNMENNWNRGPQRNNRSSGVRGVSYHSETGKWRARIVVRGNSYSLGLFATIEEAADARDAMASHLLGEFGRPAATPVTPYTR